MARKTSNNSSESTFTNGKKVMDDLNATDIAFIPLFNSKLPIEKDENGTPTLGTALLIYQGTVISPIIWTKEDGEEKCVKSKKHVFACKTSNMDWKNIEIQTTKYSAGNLLDRFLNAMNIEGYLESVVDETEEDGFNEGLKFNDSLVDLELKKLVGFSYTAQLERIQTKKGMKLYRVVVNTLKPILDVNGNHKQRMSPETCNPFVQAIYSTSEE
jgi:hypothetical protein